MNVLENVLIIDKSRVVEKFGSPGKVRMLDMYIVIDKEKNTFDVKKSRYVLETGEFPLYLLNAYLEEHSRIIKEHQEQNEKAQWFI